ncbi:MAG: phosphate--AMP phosphotransferase, partial [Acidobacteria bacterium]|nr:phosphate--AMP phosphotransferase [Acidobacteriota bacterium]
MLETLDLAARLGNKAYREAMDRLELELPILHLAILEHGIPVLVLFEGWFSSGRGDSIGQLVHHLDPRATRVHVTHASSEEDRRRPWPWRFWRRTPACGRIEVFDRSWYYLLWNQR